MKAAAAVGVDAVHIKLDAAVSQTELLALIEKHSAAKTFDGILIQLPLPRQIDEQTVLHRLDQSVDVDGLSSASIASIWTVKNFDPLTRVCPCTPKGIVKLLQFYGIDPGGKNVLIINRSNIVGKPLAALLLALNATVTVCHTRTKNLNDHLQAADIIVTGAGVIDFLQPVQIPPTAAVIDVSINFDADGKIVGDVRPNTLIGRCAAFSPVPGGVGPMTVAAIFDNLYLLTKQRVDHGHE